MEKECIVNRNFPTERVFKIGFDFVTQAIIVR